jgi:glycosyltransferase involved in cell wall biosynthesis
VSSPVNNTASEVHVVVPATIDDPASPSGGNVYDRRVCDGLELTGWSVRLHPVAAPWPAGGSAAREALSSTMAALPDGAVVLVDGLLASAAPEVLVPQSRRLRLVVLMHMPLGQPETGGTAALQAECRVLCSAAAVVSTSEWTRHWLLEHYPLAADQVRVAWPGADTAETALGTATGGQLLCVAAVTPSKGHDVLVEALAAVSDLDWRCVCVGDLTRDPSFVEHVRGMARASGISDRFELVGPRAHAELQASYAAADALVLASRLESYGMVVTESLAHGLPVLATRVGGLPEALGELPDGRRPGLLVRPNDPEALAEQLRRWLTDAGLRRRLRDAARTRRAALTGWATTTRHVASVLSQVAA